uniref:GNAT family N-acetyltransferase n=1 Tax=Radiobacillus sp. PE A8.2 TaxID=3380349 RepID=UPI00388F9D63
FKKGYSSVYVHQLSVNSSNRKSGYGSLLMDEVYKIASDKGIKLVELDYWCKNEAAIGFYQKHGFESYRAFVYKNI